MADILIIDDEEYIRDILSSRVKRLGHNPWTAATLAGGMEKLETRAFDLVFLDVNLPDGSGLSVLPAIKQNPSAPEVIIITAVGSSKGAELAIKNGAWDYIGKPFKKEDIILLIRQTLEYRRARLQQHQPRMLEIDAIVGKSSLIKECIRKVARCCSNTANVFIHGETGTGKELFARAIHDNCLITNDNYIVVDCAALPEALAESVLFGHTKGAFTGAETESKGLVKNADQGTLFLDEIGELPLSVQKKFLRVLQEKKFRPVGSSVEIFSNFRLISATNRDLDQMVAQGNFRQDLLHRLKTFTIGLPTLRDRKEDIKGLAMHYTDKLCQKHNISSKALLPDTLDLLLSYDWPGNVRELVNAIEKAILSEPDLPLLYPVFLPARIRLARAQKEFKDESSISLQPVQQIVPDIPLGSVLSPGDLSEGVPDIKTYRNNAIGKIETIYLRYLLGHTGNDLDEASRISGVSKNRLYFLLRKHRVKIDN